MNSELSPAPLSALPVRRREILEILDTSLKLYRRYFWVLLGWSAIVFSLALLPFVSFFSLFLMPLLYGAVSCCVAAAVRGQNVKFSQCWAFTKPRYGALLGTLLLSYLLLMAISFAVVMAAVLVWLLGVWALSGAPEPLQIVGGIVGFVLGLVAFSVIGVAAFGWMNMVPVVVCLEDDKRSSAAIGRAFDLLKGNWRRVLSLSLLLGLAALVVVLLVGAVFALFGLGAIGGANNAWFDAFSGIFVTMTAFMALVTLLWYPAQTLIIAVLYLDLRVRREALDLEWTAYASAPVATSEIVPPTSPTPTGPTTASGPVYLPTSNHAAIGESPFPDAPATPASFSAGKIQSVEINPERSDDPAPAPFSGGANEVSRD